MDPDAPHCFFNHSNAFHSPMNYGSIDENYDGMIDLGLSLRTLQPQAHDHSGPATGPVSMAKWVHADDCEETRSHSKERRIYVKVSMDGVAVGRKICILQNSDYSTLGFQLEDMFGADCPSGLRLFQEGSTYTLFYKDKDERWRTVGDIPWKEFVDAVNRLRIVGDYISKNK